MGQTSIPTNSKPFALLKARESTTVPSLTPSRMDVAVDKFTKWIEAKPIKNLDAGTAISFIRELIFRYGVPHSIITDNGSNFDSDQFKAFCASQGTRVDYGSVAHPQSNGQAERANGLILKGLKPRLMRDLKHAAGAWVDELPSVLWGLRTTPNRLGIEDYPKSVDWENSILPGLWS